MKKTEQFPESALVGQFVVINDTTLRDGEQTAGVAFTLEERLMIARALARAGVPELEIGIPAMGVREREEIRALAALNLPSRLIVWCRMHGDDLRAAKDLGVDTVNLSISVSDQQIARKLGQDRAWVLERIAAMTARAQDMGFTVCLGGEDSSRADEDFLLQVLEVAERAGVRRFRYADTMGVLDPFRTREVFQRLRAATSLELEIHAHNDLGLATANTIAAILGGATHASTTANGLGERAGNAALEEIVIALRHLYGADTGVDPLQLGVISHLVALASNRPVPVNKSIVGDAIFTHESGIHVSGLLRDQANYQAINPQELGRHHHLVLGKHSGRASVRWAYQNLGIQLTERQEDLLLEKVREYAVRLKKAPTSADMLRFYEGIGGGCGLQAAYVFDETGALRS